MEHSVAQRQPDREQDAQRAEQAEQEARELRELEEAREARLRVQERYAEEERRHPEHDARTAADLIDEDRGIHA